MIPWQKKKVSNANNNDNEPKNFKDRVLRLLRSHKEKFLKLLQHSVGNTLQQLEQKHGNDIIFLFNILMSFYICGYKKYFLPSLKKKKKIRRDKR